MEGTAGNDGGSATQGGGRRTDESLANAVLPGLLVAVRRPKEASGNVVGVICDSSEAHRWLWWWVHARKKKNKGR